MESQSCVESKVTEIPLSDLSPDPNQPRRYFDPDKQAELRESIRANGILTPLFYREEEGKKIIVSGERRYKAAQECDINTVPAQRVLKDHEFVAVTENMNRDSLTPMEQAKAIKALIKNDVEQKDVAGKLGLSESTVSEMIKPCELSQEMQEEVLKSPFWSRNMLLRLAKVKDIRKRKVLFNDMQKIVAKREEIKKQKSVGTYPVKEKTAKNEKKTTAISRKISGINNKPKALSTQLRKEIESKLSNEYTKQVKEELEALRETIDNFLRGNNINTNIVPPGTATHPDRSSPGTSIYKYQPKIKTANHVHEVPKSEH
ncbi:MAG: ParB/RepB/Spo0J family partition protein [Clostridiales bacterium]|jgi:ParB family chromosome partitioning protein|nr:ParB/RepB/Spo0J family partition protein [Clostridiales bacterium]